MYSDKRRPEGLITGLAFGLLRNNSTLAPIACISTDIFIAAPVEAMRKGVLANSGLATLVCHN